MWDSTWGNVPVVFNPLTKLASPQYQVIFDESFSTAPLSDVASSEEKMLEHFDRLFADHTWEHYDQFIDSESSYHYFDANWDVDAIQEDLFERRRTVKRALARAMQKNGVLRRELGLPKRRGGDAIPPGSVGADSTTRFSTDISNLAAAVIVPGQATQGVIRDKIWKQTLRPRKKRKRRATPTSTSEGGGSIREGAASIPFTHLIS